MLTKGLQHVAIITKDTDRFLAFYRDVFEVVVVKDGAKILHGEGPRLSIIEIGEFSDIWVCEIEGNTEADRQTPLFGRGHLDHLALQAASLEAFGEIRSRLMARGAADDFVTDFGFMLSTIFRDPDGLEGEVCVENPDGGPGDLHPADTRSARYS